MSSRVVLDRPRCAIPQLRRLTQRPKYPRNGDMYRTTFGSNRPAVRRQLDHQRYGDGARTTLFKVSPDTTPHLAPGHGKSSTSAREGEYELNTPRRRSPSVVPEQIRRKKKSSTSEGRAGSFWGFNPVEARSFQAKPTSPRPPPWGPRPRTCMLLVEGALPRPPPTYTVSHTGVRHGTTASGW